MPKQLCCIDCGKQTQSGVKCSCIVYEVYMASCDCSVAAAGVVSAVAAPVADGSAGDPA